MGSENKMIKSFKAQPRTEGPMLHNNYKYVLQILIYNLQLKDTTNLMEATQHSLIGTNMVRDILSRDISSNVL